MLLMGCGFTWGATLYPITYKVPDDTKVSLAVYSTNGVMLREILRAEPRSAGSHTEYWDGLNQQGVAQPAGNYSWKLLTTKGLTAEYLLTLGTKVTPSYARWPGGYAGGPFAVAVDATGMYVMGTECEGSPTVIKQSLDGNTHYWDYDNGAATVTLSVDAGRVYMLMANATVIVLDAASGGTISNPLCNLHWDPVQPGAERGTHSTQQNMDMAVKSNVMAVSYTLHNAIRWHSATNGALLDSVTLPAAPSGISQAVDGTVYFIMDGAIYTLTRANKTPVLRVAASALNSPKRLDVDGSSLFVAEAGTSQRVKKFNAATGALISVYGTEGGRPAFGLYDNTGFLGVTDICGDGAGGFLITEPWNAPRRAAHYAATGGAPVREWYGGQEFFCFSFADPADPSQVWIGSQYNEIIHAQVNYTAKTWSVRACYKYNNACGPGNEMLFPKDLSLGQKWGVTHRNGHTYLYGDVNIPCLLRVDEANRRLVPVAVANSINGLLPAAFPQVYKDAMTLAGHDWQDKANMASRQYCSYSWSDQNDNGLAEANEVDLHKAWDFCGTYGGAQIPFDHSTFAFTLWIGTLAPQGWSSGGNPKYTWATLTGGVPRPPTLVDPINVGIAVDPIAKRTYQVFHDRNTEGFGLPGGWPESVGTIHVFGWDETKTQKFDVGRRSYTYGVVPNGQITYASSFNGTTHGCVVLSDRTGNPPVWDRDGLFVGTLFDHHVADGLPEWIYHYGSFAGYPLINYDNQAGTLYTSPTTGEVFWYAVGQNANTPVYRITGWDSFARQTGSVTVKGIPESAVKTGTGLAAEYFNNADLSGAPVLARTDAQVWMTQGAIQPGVNANEFSARWSGQVEAPMTDDYVFTLRVTGGSRLWIGGRLVLDCWYNNQEFIGTPKMTTPIRLEAGKKYAVKLEYHKYAGNPSGLHLIWENFTLDPLHIPQVVLTPALPGVPVVAIITSPAYLQETGRAATFLVTRTGSTTTALTVPYTCTGSAVSGVNYVAPSGTVTIPAGQSSALITVTLRNDKAATGPMTLTLTPAISDRYLIGTPESATRVILDTQSDVVLAHLKLWLKADSLALSDGKPVATWSNSAMNSCHATQLIAGQQPLFKTNGLNGKPIVRFDGIDDYLTGAAFRMDGVDAFIVAKLDPSTGGDTGLLSMTTPPLADCRNYSSTSGDSAVFWLNSNNAGAGLFWKGLGPVSTPLAKGMWWLYQMNAADTPWQPGDQQAIGAVAVQATGLDGSVTSFGTGRFTGHITPIGLSPSRYGLGCRLQPEPSGYAAADIAEIVIYDQPLDPVLQQAVTDALRRKYGFGSK